MESEDSNSVGETASIRPIPWLNDIANYILYTRECNALDAYLILSCRNTCSLISTLRTLAERFFALK